MCLVGEHIRLVLELVERCLELTRVPIHGVFIHDRVVHHDGQAVDETGLGNVFGFEETGAVGTRLSLHRAGLRRRDGGGGQGDGAQEVASRHHLEFLVRGD